MWEYYLPRPRNGGRFRRQITVHDMNRRACREALPGGVVFGVSLRPERGTPTRRNWFNFAITHDAK